jgi:hypothetical protein
LADTNGRLRDHIARGRIRHAALCIDTVTVARVTRGALNTTTGVYATTSTPIYSGPARVKRELSVDQVAGDGERQVARVILALPFDETGSADLRAGDVVTITVSEDPALTGQTCVVVGPEHGTTATAHRYTIEDVAP